VTNWRVLFRHELIVSGAAVRQARGRRGVTIRERPRGDRDTAVHLRRSLGIGERAFRQIRQSGSTGETVDADGGAGTAAVRLVAAHRQVPLRSSAGCTALT
jgi:hypothetical protein